MRHVNLSQDSFKIEFLGDSVGDLNWKYFYEFRQLRHPHLALILLLYSKADLRDKILLACGLSSRQCRTQEDWRKLELEIRGRGGCEQEGSGI